MKRSRITVLTILLCTSAVATAHAQSDPFPQLVSRLRPSTVAIGSYHFRDTPTAAYYGSGFVVTDGLHAVTNAHVVEMVEKAERIEQLRVFLPDDDRVQGRAARVVATDEIHDLALLAFEGPAVSAVTLSDQGDPPAGASIGVLGYPLGMALGVEPAVHRGVVAAVVPAVQPVPSGTRLTPRLIRALKQPYQLYQLDVLVMPGSSGSAVFDATDGRVVAVINKTLAAGTREHLIQSPTGIGYAVPSVWVRKLIESARRLSEAATSSSTTTRRGE